MPKVTICVPLFNQADTIERCLAGVFAQTFTDYELIIADDLSDDGSPEIAERLIRGREHCRLIRHREKHYFNNFVALIDLVETEFFVLLAGDDYWDSTFLEETISVMEADKSLVGCVPKCQHYHDDGHTSVAQDTFPLKGHFIDKLDLFISRGFNNNRMYGLYRTALAKDCYPRTIMHAQDIAFTINTLARGDYAEVDQLLMHRDFTPIERYVASVRRDDPSLLGQLFPFRRAAVALLKGGIIPKGWRTRRKLCLLNFELHHRQMRFLHPRYYAFAGPLYRFLHRYVMWRL